MGVLEAASRAVAKANGFDYSGESIIENALGFGSSAVTAARSSSRNHMIQDRPERQRPEQSQPEPEPRHRMMPRVPTIRDLRMVQATRLAVLALRLMRSSLPTRSHVSRCATSRTRLVLSPGVTPINSARSRLLATDPPARSSAAITG